MPRREKFPEKSIQAFSSWNWTWEGVELEVDASKWKGVWDKADLRLDAIKQLIEREREREREREIEKYQHRSISIRRKKIGMYAWKMHEHVTCNKKKYHELSPIQSYRYTWFQHSKHTSIIHQSLLKCKCDAMHELLRSFKQNPTQKSYKNLI